MTNSITFTNAILLFVSCLTVTQAQSNPGLVPLDTKLAVRTEDYRAWSIEFHKDHTYVAQYGSIGQQFWEDSGSFKISENSIALQPLSCSFGPAPQQASHDCNHSLGVASCTVATEPGWLYDTKTLNCVSKNNSFPPFATKSLSFPFPRPEIPRNAKRQFHGVPVIFMGFANGRTTSGVKIRSAPSDSAPVVTFQPATQDLHSGIQGKLDAPLPFVPSGVTLEIIARTLEKHQVQRWNNYWYLVNVGMNNEVWIFAEFVQIP